MVCSVFEDSGTPHLTKTIEKLAKRRLRRLDQHANISWMKAMMIGVESFGFGLTGPT